MNAESSVGWPQLLFIPFDASNCIVTGTDAARLVMVRRKILDVTNSVVGSPSLYQAPSNLRKPLFNSCSTSSLMMGKRVKNEYFMRSCKK